MGICYENEFTLPNGTAQIAWTATGPVQIVDENRESITFYYLFSPGDFFSQVAEKFKELVDGEDDKIAENVSIQQENQEENMPIFALSGTLVTY